MKDLREALRALESWGELRRVKAQVDPHLEVAEVARRVMYARGPALLFENVKGFPGWRMATNMFRSVETIRKLLGVERLEEIGERLTKPLSSPPPMGLGEKVQTLYEVLKIGSYTPKKVGRGAFEENVIEANGFDRTPIPKTWPLDAGRYITYGLTVTRDPDKGISNMGLYRVQVIDGNRAAMHWQVHKRGHLAWWKVKERGAKKIKAAIVVGSDPGTMLTGAMPVPYPLDKLLFASVVRGSALEVVELDGLLVPANAEVVYVGEVDTEVLVDEGPFGDHTGYYTPPAKFPQFRLERVYYRSDPIYYFTVVGKPLLEDAWIGKAIERAFLPFMKMFMPEVVDVNMPPEGLFTGGIAIVSIKKRYPGHAKKVMMGLWGLGLFSLVKVIVIVDHDVNPHDIGQVFYAISTTVDPQRDVLVVPYAVTDELDHAAMPGGYGSKLGIDATRKMKVENYGQEWPQEVEPDPETVELVNRRWREYGI
ncbi:MAG: UbiD family decarboxylase [Acidilobaceae archaeon]|nr:UbiD family decarboxylase [Acidilobaceae archaeon]MDW7974862.1 UbiD family decarboxylase [Sulfolobales archaeon]